MTMLFEPMQMLMAQNSSNKYVVVRIKKHDSQVSIIDVQRKGSVFRIYSILREPIDSTYDRLRVGTQVDVELYSLQEWFSQMHKNMMTSFTIVHVMYPGICVGNEPPRGIVGEYLCSRLNGRYIKKDSFPLCPISLDDFYNSRDLDLPEEKE